MEGRTERREEEWVTENEKAMRKMTRETEVTTTIKKEMEKWRMKENYSKGTHFLLSFYL